MTKQLPTPHAYNVTGGLVAGAWYRAVAATCAFDFWVERRLARAELRLVALRFIGEAVYCLEDIDSVRRTKGPKP